MGNIISGVKMNVKLGVNASSLLCRMIHWTMGIGVKTTFLYRLPITNCSAITRIVFMFTATFAEDVLNNCLLLADRNGSIRYLPSFDIMSNCPNNSDNCEEIITIIFVMF